MAMLSLAFAMLGAGIALVVGLYAMPIGRRLGLLDFPDPGGGRKLHAAVTPLVGGIALVGATLAGATLLWALLPPDPSRNVLLWFMATVLGTCLVGLADDRFGLTAPTRLLAASALLLAAIAQVPEFAITFLRFSGQHQLILLEGLVGIVFTLLCFVGLLNAVNMADGKNGLVIGQALLWAAILYPRLPEPARLLVLAVGGALAVLLVFNLKGRLFLGDGGSYGLSAIFGLLAIHAWNQGFDRMRADDLALIFAVPVFDTLRLIVHRLARRKSPFTPGRDHLHHYLHARWGWPRPLPWVLALVALPNMGALLLPGTAWAWLIATLAGYLALLRAATAELKPRTA